MANRYFEDFHTGQQFAHRRGRTFTQEENARWTLLTMNTAQAHWNREHMRHYMDGQFTEPLVNATLVIAVTVGLTTQDLSENGAGMEMLHRIDIAKPVTAGDTLWSTSEILATAPDPERPDLGRIEYAITSVNQHGERVCSLVRTVTIKRASHLRERDLAYRETHWKPIQPS